MKKTVLGLLWLKKKTQKKPDIHMEGVYCLLYPKIKAGGRAVVCRGSKDASGSPPFLLSRSWLDPPRRWHHVWVCFLPHGGHCQLQAHNFNRKESKKNSSFPVVLMLAPRLNRFAHS